MMLSIFERTKKVRETTFSRFIREASSADKKRVYAEVLRKATDRQMRVIEKAGRGHETCVEVGGK